MNGEKRLPLMASCLYSFVWVEYRVYHKVGASSILRFPIVWSKFKYRECKKVCSPISFLQLRVRYRLWGKTGEYSMCRNKHTSPFRSPLSAICIRSHYYNFVASLSVWPRGLRSNTEIADSNPVQDKFVHIFQRFPVLSNWPITCPTSSTHMSEK
jgi:hypothetical protein